MNDTLSTATNISIGSSAVGVLDSPLDIDYYKVSVTKGYIMKYSISTTADYSLVYKGKSGSNAAIYKVGNEDDKVLIMPGVYYFAVLSKITHILRHLNIRLISQKYMNYRPILQQK